jgi:HEAT repeat protein
MVPDRGLIIDLFRRLHTSPEEHAAALTRFRTFEPTETVDRLSEFLADSDINVVGDAANMIMMIDPMRGTALILPLMRHSKDTVRWCACRLFAGYGRSYDRTNEDVRRAIENVLLTDSADDVRLMAAEALGSISHPAAVTALQHAADNDKGADWEGRTVADAARKAIERITTPPKPRWS